MGDIFFRNGRRALVRGVGQASEGVQSLRRAGFAGVLTAALVMAFSTAASAAEVSTVQELHDRAEITDLVSTLLFAEDRKDADAFAGTFAPDGLLDIRDPKAPMQAKGREAIRKFARGPAPPPAGGVAAAPPVAPGAPGGMAGATDGPPGPHRHISVNSYVKIVDRNHARHWSYWITVGLRHAPAPGDAADTKLLGIIGQDMNVLGSGIYDDDLVKIDGKWYFQVHRLRYDTVKPE